MNKNKGVSRFAERTGWFVTLVTFFCGTIFLLIQQEVNHRKQMEKLLQDAQRPTAKLEKTILSQEDPLPVTFSSKVLPPLGSRIGQAFWVSDKLEVMSTEVTKGLYSSVMLGTVAGDTPMLFSGMHNVLQFANALSVHQGLRQCYVNDLLLQDCSGWRIPTDNEWMLFASAGQGTKYAGSDVFSDVGWRTSKVYDVASKPPNSWGMHDMSGGAREVVFDIKDKRYGLLGDEQPLAHMRIQELEGNFAVRLVRIAPKETYRNQ